MAEGLFAYFIVGPTAVGKTEVAHYLARKRGLAVLSADSMAIYRGMDIGTSKPTSAQRGEVRYFGIDIVDPDGFFSAGGYRAYALGVLRGLRDEGVRAVVVGGTGLYVKFLTHGVSDAAPIDASRRAHWEGMLAEGGVEALAAALREIGGAAGRAPSDWENPRRLIRALERTESGIGLSGGGEWRQSGGMIPYLDAPVSDCAVRIRNRVAAMYSAGLVEEVRGLVSRGISGTASHAIGYREAALVACGELSESEGMDATYRRTVQLAKRQRTWFRHQERCRRVEVSVGVSVAEVAAQVERWWGEDGPCEIG